MTAQHDVVVQYVLDGSDDDLRRLLGISALLTSNTRAALSTVDVRPGWQALECGCGPVGAMPILSELVGPSGHVVGVDFAPDTVARARSVVAELGLRNVEVRVADINADADAAAVGGPYDLAFTRCFLMHQQDPVHTLTRIAAVLRPGGWLVAMEPLPAPAPFSYPPDDTLRVAWDLLHRAIARSGAAPNAVSELPASARAAGFEVVEMGGSFQPTDPRTGYGLHAATSLAVRDRIISTGSASAAEIDEVIERLQAAGDAASTGWVTSPLSLTLTLRKAGEPAERSR
jgi:SAM-dependent methyltransferase